ncbi:hypothetical protein [Polaromonas sp.]|uniref:hypothetical protein n=1 Tax=Polaromonas sp. TaxID=1869339 RepID=UPI0024898E47|nr:hypothetical protein [Polaromonas sp.]MDI1275295.1 hypothetical protein [Polaromonas sp.]
MKLPDTPPESASSPDPAILREEAARYALLRRIAPAIRHHLAGTLQPIGMIAAILDRRLQSETPDLAVLRDNSKSISTLSRSASTASMNLITWVVPKENGSIALEAGIEEALGMLATDLAFRGFAVSNKVNAPDVMTSVFALRTVFTASLIALTDAAQAPASVVLSSEAAGGQTRVCITLTRTEGEAVPDEGRGYRTLSWDDVQALADAEHVRIRYSAAHADMLFSEVEQALVTG